MTYLDFLIIVALAFLIAVIFVVVLKAAGPWGSFWTFYLVLLLGILAAAFWIKPVESSMDEVSWGMMAVVGLSLALILALAGSNPAAQRKRNAISGKIVPADPDAAERVNAAFWIVISILLTAIIIGVTLEHLT